MRTAAGALDNFIPIPRLEDLKHVDVGAPVGRTWEHVRHLDFGSSPVVRALFGARTLAARLRRPQKVAPRFGIDDITRHGAGFRILDERPGVSITVGAIGKVWQPEIDFADVEPADFAAFADPGWVKVAWEIRCTPRGTSVTRITLEVRVTATDNVSWEKFETYFKYIGPFSEFIRRHLLALAIQDLGSPESAEQSMALPGDALLPDAAREVTDGVTIASSPHSIWPWLVQMGCRRAGWYSWDALDNGGTRRERVIRPDLQDLRVGNIVPATPLGNEGFEVLSLVADSTLVFGGLYDLETGRQFPFHAQRPARYWHVTWSFFLEPLDAQTTRLHVRARAAVGPLEVSALARLRMMRLVHHFMETAQLRNLRERVEQANGRERPENVRPATQAGKTLP